MASVSNPAINPWRNCEELWDHALQLGEQLKTVSLDVNSLWPDVQVLLHSGRGGHPHRQEIYDEILRGHDMFAERMAANHGRVGALYSNSRLGSMAVRLRQIQSALHTVDPKTLSNEVTLAILRRQTDRAFAAPYEWQFLIASATIPVFRSSLLFRDTLAVFLERPTASRAVLDASAKLLKAAALELLGKATPFVGVMMVLAEVTVPHIERQLEQAKHANDFMDRLFLLGDNVDSCLEDSQYAQKALDASEETLADFDKRFERACSWVTGLLGAAG